MRDVFPEDVCKRITEVADVVPFPHRDAEVLLTGWGCPRLTAERLAELPALKAVMHAAGSVKGHVTEAVFQRGILVSSAATVNAQPVAEYTVAMLVLGLKRIFPLARAYAHGSPRLAHEPGDRTGISGSTIGVVGASRIGRLVVELLKPYDVRVLLHDPHAGQRLIVGLGAEPSDLDTLCAEADAVTIHAPELPETRHLFDEYRLSLLRDGSLLINTARGSLVDTEALTRHCASGRIDAILDVTTPEPLPPGHPLLALPNVLVTPHLAGSRGRELRRLGAYAAAELERYVAGLPLHGLVDPLELPRTA